MENITQKQIEKVELRVERLDDKLDAVREEVLELKSDVRMYANEVSKHVKGDEKIISEILPTIHSLNELLPELKGLVLKDKARQIQEQQDQKDRTKLKTNIGIVGGLVGLVMAILGYFFKK